MRSLLGASLLVLTACGSGSIGIGDGPTRQCPGWGLSEDALAIESASLTEPSEVVLTVTNDCLQDEGDLVVGLSIAAEGFTVEPAELTVAAQESAEVIIRYEADSYDPAEGELVLENNIEALGTVTVPVSVTVATDQDGDGYEAAEVGGEDCDDTDPAINPGAPEIYYDGIDQDCDGASDYDQDGDGQDVGPEGTDCDDTDPTIFEGADELDDLADNDCDGWVDEHLLRPGDLIVTEIMHDPVAVFDTSGEWFEVLNVSGRTLDLVNWSVRDYNGDQFTIQDSFRLDPGARAVLGVDADPVRNGGVSVDYVYDRETFDLGNSTDAIGMEVDGNVISLVEYDTSWRQAPGRSMQLDVDFQDRAYATQARYWCAATEVYGDGTDKGSPGEDNEYCTVVDHDGDGFSIATGDCDDANPAISPKADEVWNGTDDDCDGTTDRSDITDVESAYLEGDGGDYLTYIAGLSEGDVDQDGDVELVVGGTRVGGVIAGLLYTFEGADASSWSDRASDVDEAEIIADHAYNSMGLIGARQGDVTGDGNTDLVVGGSSGYGGSGDDPTILLFSSGSVSGSLDQDDADATFDGIRGQFDGNRVASHLDLDGDGTNELLFMDPTWSGGGTTQTGAVLLIDAAGASGSARLADSVERQWYGGRWYERFGNSLDGADLDSDGYDDLFTCGVGANGNTGACYMIAGAGTWKESGELEEQADFEIDGGSFTARLGFAPRAGFGDFDGDADLDLVLGHPYNGSAHVFLDAANLSGNIDINDADVEIEPRTSPAYFGMSVATGDFDGDGTDDVAIGAPDNLYFTGGDETGEVFVWSGKTLAGGVSSVDEDDVWGSVSGFAVGDAFGHVLLGADLEADGVDDLIIGSPGWDTNHGRVSIILLD